MSMGHGLCVPLKNFPHCMVNDIFVLHFTFLINVTQWYCTCMVQYNLRLCWYSTRGTEEIIEFYMPLVCTVATGRKEKKTKNQIDI